MLTDCPSRAALSFGLVQGRPLFMDEREDSYFLLDADQEQELLELLAKADGTAELSPGLCRSLGLPDRSPAPGPAACQRALQSLYDRNEARHRARLMDVLKLWRILLRVRRALKARPLQAILADLGTPAASGDEARASEIVVERATRFAAARAAVPITPNCLLDSLALVEWLGPARGATSLVFAVKLDPFAAHCWVQAGATLLNDRLDDIARFEPVRIVACSHATR
jgi:hypothetical protein